MTHHHWGYRVPAAIAKAKGSKSKTRRQAGDMLALLWEEHTAVHRFDANFDHHAGDEDCRVCSVVREVTEEQEK